MQRSYFLGGNTPKGFFSYYDSLIDKTEAKRVFVIKGGPGTGKSSMMKSVASWARENGMTVDDIHCSSDPDSLDGILIHEIKAAMVDGTSPHIVDPVYPGCCDEIINMGDCWYREGIFEKHDRIIYYTNTISEYFKTAYRYLAAAGELYKNMLDMCRKYSVMTTEQDIAREIMEREVQKPSQKGRGRVRRLFASAITPKGIISYADTIASEKTYVINSGANIACNIMELLAERLCEKYYDIECFYDPLLPGEKTDHISVPEIGLSILTCNMTNSVKSENTVDVTGMLKNEDMAMLCYKETMAEVNKAVKIIGKAKEMHDELEKCYVPHMDFEKAEKKKQYVIKELTRLM